MALTSSLFFSGIIAVILVFFIFLILALLRPNRRLHTSLDRMTTTVWFQNPWACGGLVFFYNVLLLGLVIFIFFVVPLLWHVFIPVILYAPIAVAASVFGWLWIGNSWTGKLSGRLKIAFIGSSLYWMLTAFAIYKFLTLKPAFQGDDTFMAALGLMILTFIAVTAAIICMFSIGWPRKKQ